MTKAELAIGATRAYRNAWLCFGEYFGLLAKGSQHKLYLRNGLRLALRAGTSDFPIAHEMFVRQVYDSALSIIGPGSNVIDIGAQSGIFSVAAAARGARVFCYEPFHENGLQLALNAELNGFADRINLNEAAVAGKAGEAELLYKDYDTGGGTLYQEVHRDWGRDGEVRKVKVKVVTLADVFKNAKIEHCDCLKLDCEGAEYDILLSSPPELDRTEVIILEYHPNGDVGELRKVLEAAGFRVKLTSFDETDTLLATRSPA